MQKYKPSMFNISLEENDERIFVFNPLGRRPLAKFHRDFYSKIFNVEKIDIENFKQDDIRNLLELGYIVDYEKDEMKEFLDARSKYINNKNPQNMKFIFAPTMKCNYKCIYCFEETACKEGKLTRVDLDDIYEFIINSVVRNKECKSVELLLFGGEPLLVVDDIYYLTRKLKLALNNKRIDFVSIIVTNGYFLNGEVCQALIDSANLKVAQITIDGLEESYNAIKRAPKGAYERVLNNIEEICEKVLVRIRVNVDKNNKDECKQLYDYLMHKRNLKGKVQIYFTKVYDEIGKDNMTSTEYNKFLDEMLNIIHANGDLENLNYYLPMVKVTQCAAMQQEFACIGPDKKLYRCEHTLGHPEFAIGDIYTGRKENSLGDQMLKDIIPERCKKCNYYPLCLNGCIHDRTIKGITTNCEDIKQRIKLDIKALYYKHT